ncbi:DMT family transporter [Pelagibacterium halotolerans]|uniref:Putative transmembrane protein n=1 Tax=Pelagibacterium halotolerans (strain DSM 22347 / JCM 15775 / CGMCC 1.7692 / B2) TaxID=1082931 RepID=G4R8P8_PELHB|nr:DMT family transporter [Pelagibacterium halotolerans]AEQ50334.1 putative transmembrane protein [Pelagibacterium halotolerans B2]QJR19684.1 DMT family transporter [Pelagibacterium halotolerans]SEA98182.1 EamA-like transporter family protein [Pelagibacterium halotolerans]
MSQISSLPHAPVLGAAFMVGAGITFAITNILTPIITYQMGVPSTAVVFWQYVIATLFALPLIQRIGISKLRTRHPYWHETRALLSALGVQFFAFGFALGVPVWQMVALSMTGPFFILIGATLFLGERLTVQRLGATITGFVGAVMVSQIGTEQFTLASLLPVLAALCWGSVSVITRYLSRDEEPESLTLYMLVLITPNHFLIGLLVGIAVAVLPTGALPAGLATGFDFQLPLGDPLMLIVLLGLVTAGAQYFLSFAYKVADATYLQPFDDLKLPLNTLLGWVVLSQVPAIWFWPGALLILGASSFILWSERRATPGRLQMA